MTRDNQRQTNLENLREAVQQGIDYWDDCGRDHLHGTPLTEDCGPMCRLMLAYAPFLDEAD